MSIGDSMKKLIGIEELDEITEEEVNAAKDQLTKQAPMRSAAKEVPQAAPTPAPERHQTPPMTSSSPARGERRFTVTSTNAFKLVLLEPKTFEECPKLVDSLKSRKPVIINLEKLETESLFSRQRMLILREVFPRIGRDRNSLRMTERQ